MQQTQQSRGGGGSVWSWEFFWLSGLFGLPFWRRGLWRQALPFTFVSSGVVFLANRLRQMELAVSPERAQEIVASLPQGASSLRVALAVMGEPPIVLTISFLLLSFCLMIMQFRAGFSGGKIKAAEQEAA